MPLDNHCLDWEAKYNNSWTKTTYSTSNAKTSR